jgi:hypothetical protein
VRLGFKSARLAEQLLSLGRYEGPINDLLIQSRDFWRGIVDGHGSLGILATGYAERARLDQELARLSQIADWYQDGASLQQIGLRLGVSNVTILRWMKEGGIPRRERHGGRRSMAAS